MRSKKGIGIAVLIVLSVLIFLLSALPYAFLSVAEITAEGQTFVGRFASGISVNWLYVHIIGATVALLVGPFQFIQSIRIHYPQVHRWLGRVYLLFGIFIGGISGLVLAPDTVAGPIGAVGFGALAVLWLVTGAMALVRIRSGRVQDHRRWMIRNYALTFGAVTLRLWLMVFLILGNIFLMETTYAGDEFALFVDAYRIVAWLAWVPNLLIAEWLFIRRPQARKRASRLAPSSD